jgi:hypothetical protein
VGTRTDLGGCGKSLSSPTRIRSPDRPGRSVVAIPTQLSRLAGHLGIREKKKFNNGWEKMHKCQKIQFRVRTYNFEMTAIRVITNI